MKSVAARPDKPWHKLPKEEMGGEVERLVEHYKKTQAGRRDNWLANMELYEGRKLGGGAAYGYYDKTSRITDDRLGLVRSAVSTAVSTIYAPQKPKPQFQTLGATWAVRRKAQKLERICEGIANQRQGRWINIWALTIDCATDICLQGVAPIKVVANKTRKRIEHEQVDGPDIFVDPAHGRHPRDMFQRAPISKAAAKAMAPKSAHNQIESTQPYEWHGMARNDAARSNDTIEIKYAWHLPESEDEPGRYCAVIAGVVVDESDWTAPTFPFVFPMWEPWRDGFWASGIADEGGRQALEVSDLDCRLYDREVIASNKKIFYREGSLNADELAGNEAVACIAVEPGFEFPQETIVPPFSPVELDLYRDRKQAFWDTIGMSQVSAAARREQGVSSGIAIMTLNDTKAGRQLVKAQRYEQLFVDLSHQWIWRLRELAEDDRDFMVTWPGKTLMQQVKWADADVDDDSFSVTVAPASSLPHDPAGRQEMVQTLYGSGLISQETAKSLIGWPDLDSELNVENAEFEYIDALIERYLDANVETWGMGDYEAPEGFLQNKMQALRRFSSAWFRARIDQRALRNEEEKAKAEFCIKLLSRYIVELDQLMQPPPQAMPPAPPGLPNAPPANQNMPMDALPVPPGMAPAA